jgi:hypothetical protein
MTATRRVIDFTNVKDVGNFNPRHMPDGDYRAKITQVDDHTSKNGSAPDNWVFTIQLITSSRVTFPYYCGFDPKQAWKIRNLCIAAGIPVPKKKVGLDPTKLVNREIGIALEGEEYEGKMKSVIVGVFPVSELSANAPGGTTTAKSTKAAASNDDADDDGTGDDGDDEDLEIEDI